MRSWIDEALALHAEGLDIVPIRKGEKRPVTLWRQWHKRRQTQAELHEIYDYFYSAEPPSWLEEDENGIHKGKPWLVNGNMRKRWPQPVELDWGVVTGNRSGIIVVDVDNEGAYDHAEAMQLTRTWRSAKSTRGYHFWFKHPGGTIKNAAKLADIDGLDIRGDGGYIRVAPSKDMEWISECSLDELPLFPLVDEDTPSQPTMDFDLDLSGIEANSVRQTAEDFLKEKSGGLKIGQGNRNDLMAEGVGRLIAERADRDWVTEQALILRERFFDTAGFPERETLRTIESVWTLDTQQHPDRHVDLPMKERPKLGYISDYNAERFLDALPPRQPAFVETIFEPGKATMFAGYAGSGKSELMMQLLKAACDPSKVGTFVGPWQVQATARALVLDPENNPHLIMDRLKRFSLIGNSADNLRVIPGSVPGEDGMVETALNLTEQTGLTRLGDLLKEHRPNIIVFDTVRSHFPGLKENDAAEWTKYNVLTQKLCRMGLCVVWLHHSNKPGPDGYSTEAGSSHALTNISTQIFVKPVYREEAQAKRKHAIWDQDDRFNIWSSVSSSPMTPYQSLAKYAGIGEQQIERVAQVSYGKVREANPITEETYYLGQASDPKSMDWRPHLWSTPSPKQLAMHYAKYGATPITISKNTGVPIAILKEWGVVASDQGT